MDIPAQGRPQTHQGVDRVAPPEDGAVRWIDLHLEDDQELERLAEHFHFHPLALEDCAHFDQRPKYEDYGEYCFIVTHSFTLESEGAEESLVAHELHSFLGPNYLVTVHHDPFEQVDHVWSRLMESAAMARRGPDFVRYLIADAVVDALFPIVERISASVEEVEDALLNQDPQAAALEEILRIRRGIIALRKVLTPQIDVIARLYLREDEYVSERTAPYFRDVHDRLTRIAEAIETDRDLLEALINGYHWALSERTNNVVKRLTVLSALFLPLMFLTGFFGQNFEAIPFHSTGLMLLMLAACVALPAGMIWLFAYTRWFR